MKKLPYPKLSGFICSLLFIAMPLLQAEESGTEKTAKAIGDMLRTSRTVHYRFAHTLLPQLLNEDPYWTIGFLELEGSKGLRRVWRDYFTDKEDTDTRVDDMNQLQLECLHEEGNITIYLITLPTPQGMPEAYYTAIIVDKERYELNYRAYEMSLPLSEDPPTPTVAYGGWNQEMEHINMGFFEDTSKEAFLDLLVREFVLGEEIPVIAGTMRAVDKEEAGEED
ncbi:MAG: hypothetical protein JW739_07765 [Opitutales bacterium]|nr:hypothetical protein [Opitutales bacterium]